MQITVVALMCHTLASIPQPVCREEIVVKDEMPMQACILSQAALADWKAHSIFAGEQWAIGRIKCVPGDYVIRGRSDASQCLCGRFAAMSKVSPLDQLCAPGLRWRFGSV
jgi:hypothetical protein